MIEQYTLLIKAIADFEKENEQVIEDYKTLLEAKNKMEQSLKLWAQEHGEVENEMVKVTVTQPWRKWLDPEILKKDRSAWMVLHKAGAVHETVEVDRAMADELVRDGKIDRELIAAAFKEEKLSQRVGIKIKA